MSPENEQRPGQGASSIVPDRGIGDQRPAHYKGADHSEQDGAPSDLERIARLLIDRCGVVELRALDAPYSKVVSGYFDNAADLVRAARSIDGKCSGVYVTVNEFNPALLARAHNRAVPKPKATTSDADVQRRRFFYIDSDPRRPSGISATDAERALAVETSEQVRTCLTGLGFPEPMRLDSGNGSHLLFAIDLPVNDGGLIERVLRALAFRFDTESVLIDCSVHNPARITKLYGTLACKGDNVPDRPHRRSRIISCPETVDVVPLELLEKVAAMCPPTGVATADGVCAGTRALDVEAFIARHGLSVSKHSAWKDGLRWILETCPFNSAHTDRSAYLLQFANGAVAFGCHHNGCEGKRWQDLRALFEPRILNPRHVDASGGAAKRATPSLVSSDSGGGGHSQTTWPEPEPLVDELPPVLSFDPSLLPSAVRAWVVDIADRVRCPIEFLVVAVMIALASVLGRKVGIRPKLRDTWLVIANLWGDVIGRPGILKTPALQEALKPIRRLEVEAKKEHDEGLSEFKAQQLVSSVRQKAGTRQLFKLLKNDPDGAVDLAEELIAVEPEKPNRRRFIVNDSTVEKLGELLNENPNGLLVYRDELIGLLHNLDKEGQEGARSFYLECWNGNGRFTYDRIARGTVDIEAAIVSIVGAIQPGPLRAYLRNAVDGGGGDDGLIQRFQLAVWPDPSREWVNVDRWPNTEAKQRAFEVFSRFNEMTADSVGAHHDADDPDEIPYLRFSDEALEVFVAWRERLERQVRAGDEHPAIESHLAKYRSLIPALALIIHLADVGHGDVGLPALTKAIGWGEFLESHARRIYSVALNPDAAVAKLLAQRILKKAVNDRFSLRDIYRHGWTGLSSRDDAARAVAVLVDHGWLREEKEQQDRGAPRTFYLINPRVFETQGDPTDKTDSHQDLSVLSVPLDDSSEQSEPSEDADWEEL